MTRLAATSLAALLALSGLAYAQAGAPPRPAPDAAPQAQPAAAPQAQPAAAPVPPADGPMGGPDAAPPPPPPPEEPPPPPPDQQLQPPPVVSPPPIVQTNTVTPTIVTVPNPPPVYIPTPTAPPPAPPAPPPAPRVSQAAGLKGNPGQYFGTDNYPPAAIRAGAQGRVVARLSVGTDGRVTDCTVSASSGNDDLDSTTCRIAKSRVRFSPAKDDSGNPIASTYTLPVRWVLPQD